MNIYTNKNILIRTIEEKDKPKVLKLYDEESFGVPTADKPSIYQMEEIINQIIAKEIIDEEYLIIEDNNEFIGYIAISQKDENKLHIGHSVIKKTKRNMGYGGLLLDVVILYANEQNCYIYTESMQKSSSLVLRSRNFSNNFIHFEYKPEKVDKKTLPQLFVPYELIKKQKERELKKDQNNFQKFLKSPMFDYIKNM